MTLAQRCLQVTFVCLRCAMAMLYYTKARILPAFQNIYILFRDSVVNILLSSKAYISLLHVAEFADYCLCSSQRTGLKLRRNEYLNNKTLTICKTGNLYLVNTSLWRKPLLTWNSQVISRHEFLTYCSDLKEQSLSHICNVSTTTDENKPHVYIKFLLVHVSGRFLPDGKIEE